MLRYSGATTIHTIRDFQSPPRGRPADVTPPSGKPATVFHRPTPLTQQQLAEMRAARLRAFGSESATAILGLPLATAVTAASAPATAHKAGVDPDPDDNGHTPDSDDCDSDSSESEGSSVYHSDSDSTKLAHPLAGRGSGNLKRTAKAAKRAPAAAASRRGHKRAREDSSHRADPHHHDDGASDSDDCAALAGGGQGCASGGCDSMPKSRPTSSRENQLWVQALQAGLKPEPRRFHHDAPPVQVITPGRHDVSPVVVPARPDTHGAFPEPATRRLCALQASLVIDEPATALFSIPFTKAMAGSDILPLVPGYIDGIRVRTQSWTVKDLQSSLFYIGAQVWGTSLFSVLFGLRSHTSNRGHKYSEIVAVFVRQCADSSVLELLSFPPSAAAVASARSCFRYSGQVTLGPASQSVQTELCLRRMSAPALQAVVASHEF